MEHLWHARSCVTSKYWEYKNEHDRQSPCLRASHLNRGTRHLAARSELFLRQPWPPSWSSVPKPRCPLFAWHLEISPKQSQGSYEDRRWCRISPHHLCLCVSEEWGGEAIQENVVKQDELFIISKAHLWQNSSEKSLSKDPQGCETGLFGQLPYLLVTGITAWEGLFPEDNQGNVLTSKVTFFTA